MKAFQPLVVAISALAFCTLAVAFPERHIVARQGPGYGAYRDEDNGSDSAGTPAVSASPSSPSSTSTQVTKGDRQCSKTMCVSAIVDGANIQYTMESLNTDMGWMGMGFGTSMLNAPMVIMWANPDGSITTSQREATKYTIPTVVANPTAKATPQPTLSLTTGKAKFVFSVPSTAQGKQRIIYAFGTDKPSSSKEDATFFQHFDQGLLSLDLSKTLASSPTGGNSNSTTAPPPGGSQGSSGAGNSNSNNGATAIPLTSNQKVMVAHAVVATLGFIVFLPLGALLPRLSRTFLPGHVWFTGHWILQFGIAGLFILIGVIMGIVAVSNGSGLHMNTPHKRVGIVLLVLYLLQISLGAIIHWVKPKNRARRPPQNYFHAFFGLLIITLSFYQVRIGYDIQWTASTGRRVSSAINVLFVIWLVLFFLLYTAGLAFIPKQYRQEAKQREEQNEKLTYPMRSQSFSGRPIGRV